jgi:hypothetical protein
MRCRQAPNDHRSTEPGKPLGENNARPLKISTQKGKRLASRLNKRTTTLLYLSETIQKHPKAKNHYFHQWQLRDSSVPESALL